MLPASNWSESDTASTGSYPNIADISVSEILEIYKEDTDLLKRILTAKVQEDKRRAAEEIRQAEEARLKSRYIDLQLGHRRSASHPVTSHEGMILQDSIPESFMAQFSNDITHQEISSIDWLSPLQARTSAGDLVSPSIQSCEITSPKEYSPLAPLNIHSRTHSAPYNSINSPKLNQTQSSYPKSDDFHPQHDQHLTAPSSSSVPKQSSLDHDRVMEALRAKLMRANSPHQSRQSDQVPQSTSPTTVLVTLILMLLRFLPWIRKQQPVIRLGSRLLSDEKTIEKKHWSPTKRVSRQTMEKIRNLANMYPDEYDTKALSSEFRLSFEAVQRILKSKFRPSSEIAKRQETNRYAAMGVRKQAEQTKGKDDSGK